MAIQAPRGVASTVTHGGQLRRWRLFRTNEGGALVDVEGLAEVVPDACVDGREEVTAALIAALESGVERCRHGLLLWVDLAIPEPFSPRPGLTIRGDGGTGEGRQLRLLAGPAMGAGRAPWTGAALEAVERHVSPGARAADVGTGSGILGLYALLLGAAAVDAVDLDPLAVAVARWNARVNGVTERFAARVGSAAALDGVYDLAIVAISDARDLPPALAAASARLARAGRLIAGPTGDADERAEVEVALRRLGLVAFDAVEVEEWLTLVAHRAGE